MSSRWRIGRKVLLVGLALVVAVGLFVVFRVGQALWYLSDRRPFPVTVSRETTYLTEPLREDGSVDYLAAVNAKLGEGVTPENNAAVLLWQALGPATIDPPLRARYFSRLGVDPPEDDQAPGDGRYFVPIGQFAARMRATSEAPSQTEVLADLEHVPATEPLDLEGQLDKAMERPWAAAEFPGLAEWLAVNEAPLAKAIEASRRPRYFDPRVAPAGEKFEVMSAGNMLASGIRVLAQALSARAMLRLSDGQVELARHDAEAAHRMAVLVAQSPSLIEQLIALATFDLGCETDRAIVARGGLNSEQLLQFRNELDQLASPKRMVEALDVGERLTCLDAISDVARTARTGGLAALIGDRTNRATVTLGPVWEADWDLVLIRANEFWDQQRAGLQLPTRAERREALSQLDDEFQRRLLEHSDMWGYFLTLLGSRAEISERVANVLLSLLLPASQAALDAEDRAAFQLELTRLAAALEAYRLDQGRYPETLEALVPNYIKAIPRDMYGEAPLKYLATANGYELRSVGRDEKLEEAPEIGDGGTVYPDAFNDDLIIRAGEPVKMELSKREPPVPR